MKRVLTPLITVLILLALAPSTASAAMLAPAATVHTVVRGDMLYSLARRYGTTIDAIMQGNHLTSTIIYVGQSLQIASSSAPPETQSVHQTGPPSLFLPAIQAPLISENCVTYYYYCRLTSEVGILQNDVEWSPVENKIAFPVYRDETRMELFTQGIAERNATRLLTVSNGVDLAWSPDGSQLAFITYIPLEFESDLYVYTLATRQLDKLTDGTASISQPHWSPDGSKLLIRRRASVNESNDLYTIQPDGEGLTRLTNTPLDEEQVNWSPDGSQIAFQLFDPSTTNFSLYVMNADGSGVHDLASSVTPDAFEPVWANDSQSLYFIAVFEGESDVYKINADGSGALRLTTDEWDEVGLDLSPDGTRLVYIAVKVIEHIEIPVKNYHLRLLATDGSSSERIDSAQGEETTLLHTGWQTDGQAISYLTSDGVFLIDVTKR